MIKVDQDGEMRLIAALFHSSRRISFPSSRISFDLLVNHFCVRLVPFIQELRFKYGTQNNQRRLSFFSGYGDGKRLS